MPVAAAVSADRQQQDALSDSEAPTAPGKLGPMLLLQPLKPDQELLDDFLEALEQTGSPVKNGVLRAALGWEEARYEAVKVELVARGNNGTRNQGDALKLLPLIQVGTSPERC